MTSFVLKIIAIISMIIDHSSYAYYGKFTYFNLLGRIAFPIFAFQISEGYIYTKSKKKYMFRLLLFSIISQIPFSLFLSLIQGADIYSLNIFFTLALGLLCIIIYDYFFKKYNVLLKILSIFIIINIMLLAELLKCDYGAFGVIILFIKKQEIFNVYFTYYSLYYQKFDKYIKIWTSLYFNYYIYYISYNSYLFI